MLVLVFGPSCVGKSTLISALKTEQGYSAIPVETTRDLRPNEVDKFQIPPAEFRAREAIGKYALVNCFFGNLYGTPMQSLEDAVRSSEVWLLDMSIQSRPLFKKRFDHLGFVLLPESEEALAAQVKKSGRVERMESILADYKANYADTQDDLVRFVNYKSSMASLVSEVKARIAEDHRRKKTNSNLI